MRDLKTVAVGKGIMLKRLNAIWAGGMRQINVIGALMMREMYTKFGRENIGFLWVVGEPLIFCVGVVGMWSILHPHGEHGIGTVAFVVTGYNPLTLWRHCVGRGLKAFESNSALLFHRQVTTSDIFFSRVLLECFGSTVGFFVTASMAVLAGYMDPPKDYGLLYAGWFYVMFFSMGCAMLIAGLSETNEVLEKFLPLTTYVSIPLSGAFIMVDWVPQRYQKYFLMSPSVNASEMIRGGWMGEKVHPHYDFIFTTWACVLTFIVGWYCVRLARKYVPIY